MTIDSFLPPRRRDGASRRHGSSRAGSASYSVASAADSAEKQRGININYRGTSALVVARVGVFRKARSNGLVDVYRR